MTLKILCALIIIMLSSPTDANAWWRRPNEWFSRRTRSTTVTGHVDSVSEEKVMFKTTDGQRIQLIGNDASEVGELRNVKIRVFGNVRRPSRDYPDGAIRIRNFRVLEDVPHVAEKIPTIVEDEKPLPYEPEPILEEVRQPETIYEPTPEPVRQVSEVVKKEIETSTDDVSDDSFKQEYVVVSGDTLGKISEKVYGTTERWRDIAEFNGITNPSLLRVGMTLRMPE